MFRWATRTLLLTIAFFPFILNKTKILFKDPNLIKYCAERPYCKPNLLIPFYPIVVVHEHGDTWSYFEPIDYLFKQGRYYDDYRPPGYGIVYAFFRFMHIPPEWALWGVVGIQLLFWGWAAGLLLAEAEKNGMPTPLVWLFCAILAFSPLAYYVWMLGTESLTASVGLLGLLALLRKRYLLAGIAFTWTFFLRPAHILWVIAGLLFVLIQNRTLLPKRPVVLYLLPFLIAEGLWIARNYLIYKDFRPLSGNKAPMFTYVMAKSMYKEIQLLSLIGESNVSQIYNKNSLHALLVSNMSQYEKVDKKILSNTLPAYVTHSPCNIDTILSLIELKRKLYNERYTPEFIPVQVSPQLSLPPSHLSLYRFAPNDTDCYYEKLYIKKLDYCYKCISENMNIMDHLIKLKNNFLEALYSPSYVDAQGYTRSLRVHIKRAYYFIYMVLTLFGLLVAPLLLSSRKNLSQDTFIATHIFSWPVFILLVALYLWVGNLTRRYIDVLFLHAVWMILVWTRSLLR